MMRTLLDENEVTAESIEAWLERLSKSGYTGFYHEWPAKLWAMSYDDIIQFLKDRRASTIDPMEYYMTLPYLTDDVPRDDLVQTYTEFRIAMTHNTCPAFSITDSDWGIPAMPTEV